MKYTFAILFTLISLTAFTQTKVLQNYDYLILYNSSQITQTPSCANNVCINSLISTDTIARIHPNGIIYWKATLAASNISDTLNTGAYEGLLRINVPNTFNTQRVVQLNDVAIIFQSNVYQMSYAGAFYQMPMTIKKISDGSTMCVIYENGSIDWVTTPLVAWFGRLTNTGLRIKRITLP